MKRRKVSEAPLYAMDNKMSIARSKKAGCYYCLAIFNSQDVKKYTDDGNTVLCPRCGKDTVLPSSAFDLTKIELKKINYYWFVRSPDMTPRQNERPN